jgi:RNA polymerase sigma factor (sigma-70 family)
MSQNDAVERLPTVTPSDTQTDAELLHDVDDPVEAFAAFYRRHLEGVLRFAASRGADADVAADAAADTFMAALGARKRYDAAHGDARLWLLGIAAKKLADGHRRGALDRRRDATLQLHAERLTQRDVDGYGRLLAASEGVVLNILDDLPERQQLAIRRRVIEDRRYADIARELGLTEQATRQQVSRGLARIRTQLGRTR